MSGVWRKDSFETLFFFEKSSSEGGLHFAIPIPISLFIITFVLDFANES